MKDISGATEIIYWLIKLLTSKREVKEHHVFYIHFILYLLRIRK